MTESIVDSLHADFRMLAGLLEASSEPSLLVTADDCFRKALLLSAASYFETIVTDEILRFVEAASHNNQRVLEFVRRKALTRQFHTLFDWDAKNANKFFALFGDECRASVEARCKTDARFEAAAASFIELGRERNRLVHQNFGTFQLDKTADEIFELYQRAEEFINSLRDLLQIAEDERG